MRNKASTKIYERVVFKMFSMECCGHLLCWVNPRYPTYCPCCGKNVFTHIKQWVVFSDDEAVLEHHSDA